MTTSRSSITAWATCARWCKALEHVAPKARVRLTSNADDWRKAERVVFPGQGAIGGCMTRARQPRLRAGAARGGADQAVSRHLPRACRRSMTSARRAAARRAWASCPGACRASRRRRCTIAPPAWRLKVPHMGWNQVRQVRAAPALERGIPQDHAVLFRAQLLCRFAATADSRGVTEYGCGFTSAASMDNIFAVQFHPEKSQQAGLKLLENFVAWDGNG